MKLALNLVALLVFRSAALHAADSRYAPDWPNIAPKRVIKHTDANGDALVKTVALLQPGDHADSKYHLDTDFTGSTRTKPLSGALTR